MVQAPASTGVRAQVLLQALYIFESVASPIGAYVLSVHVVGALCVTEAAVQHGRSVAGADVKTCFWPDYGVVPEDGCDG
jgi:hypothetical protein